MSKQGQGHNSQAGQKREPISHAVNPAGVSQLGNHVGTVQAIEPLYAGRGYKAPMAGSEIHHCGSQGKHK